MKTLENEYLRVEVDERGAQLSSLFDRKKGRELLWTADPKIWGYHAPLLFPFVGMVNGGEYRYMGKTYHVRQHGFARERDFVCCLAEAERAEHMLTDDEETREKYPFEFCLKVTHELKGRSLIIGWDVANPSEEETMYFSIGAHPGFLTPPKEGIRKEDCYVLFHGVNELRYILVDLSVTAADPEHVHTMKLDEGYLKLAPHLFDIDTFIFEGGQVEKVSLCGPDRRPYVTVSCQEFPYFGLWTKSDEAPFVCLEPWYGRLDDRGFAGELPEKTGIMRLEPGEHFTASYTIDVPETIC